MFFFSRATLHETFTAKYDGVLPRTPQVRPKSEIYTPKRDDEHPHPFHVWSSPRGSNPRTSLNISFVFLLFLKLDESLLEQHRQKNMNARRLFCSRQTCQNSASASSINQMERNVHLVNEGGARTTDR